MEAEGKSAGVDRNMWQTSPRDGHVSELCPCIHVHSISRGKRVRVHSISRQVLVPKRIQVLVPKRIQVLVPTRTEHSQTSAGTQAHTIASSLHDKNNGVQGWTVEWEVLRAHTHTHRDSVGSVSKVQEGCI